MKVTVLGSSSSIPRPGRACSGYLIEAGGGALIADLGSGALANLHKVHAAEEIDAVVISHMHADHFIDVIPMRYALKYGPRTNNRRVALWLPHGGEALLRRLVDAFHPESPHDFMGEVFDIGEYDAGSVLRVGDASVRFAPTPHYITTFALRSEFEGASVTYSADTAPAHPVAELAQDTDLFLCEATLLSSESEGQTRGHLSASEAGMLAWQGGVRKLALTHYPMQTNAEELRVAAAEHFDGDLVVVDDNDVLKI